MQIGEAIQLGIRVAINGFGRMGRLALRSAFENGSGLEFVAINRGKPDVLAHLLKYDSVHGKAPFSVEAGKECIMVDGREIRVLYESDPEKLPWKELEVDIVIECSGFFKDREGAGKHLKAGASKVLISAPAKNPDVTIVRGVNDEKYDRDTHRIVSNASCTTNCVAPVAKILNDEYGILNGFMSTIHAYTTTQNILDKSHRDLRRARAAALSIIPTTTGATKALGDVIPSLKGKLDGMAFRVPTPDVSLIDLVVNLEKKASVDEVNESFRRASVGPMKGILGYSDEPLVSADYVHCSFSSVVDSIETRSMGEMVKVVSWYDNEWGYVCRLIEVAERLL
jgi:glyceraldehyde 3-phosphate dehydrogenase